MLCDTLPACMIDERKQNNCTTMLLLGHSSAHSTCCRMVGYTLNRFLCNCSPLRTSSPLIVNAIVGIPGYDGSQLPAMLWLPSFEQDSRHAVVLRGSQLLQGAAKRGWL